MSKQKHVVKKENGWSVRADGQIESNHRTQENAVKAAVASAKKEGGEVVIHGKDGKIREKNSYGNDPNPPKG